MRVVQARAFFTAAASEAAASIREKASLCLYKKRSLKAPQKAAAVEEGRLLFSRRRRRGETFLVVKVKSLGTALLTDPIPLIIVVPVIRCRRARTKSVCREIVR